MALNPTTILNKQYYTDGKKYYKIHHVSDPKTTLTEFACIELGITKRGNFTPDELTKITNKKNSTTFELLKNGKAVPIQDRGGYPDVRPGDILLTPFKCKSCGSDTPPGPKCAACGEPP